MNKKYILIGGGLVLILGGLAYYFYSKKQIEALQSDTSGVVPRPASPIRATRTISGITPQAMPADLKNLKSRTLGR